MVPKNPNRNPIINPNLSVRPFLLAIKEPSAPNPTAIARENNKNDAVNISFELVFYEIEVLMYKSIFLLDQA